ncbi:MULTISPECIES: SDR family NAD(P)-dependent oxidoreductase [Sphingobium]|uniref:SDR family NAD(P)-dependent oxidoreductase n=1 Tax=Sphingobium tyrosinilyticum TaxID=2715436 RepID=A0ABV9EXI8_9SPHN|nr:glucose 1-dehydrogenase [Sphingobium sp. EP60837]ANI79666.1 Gluconate 5-dehydrogenase [Sphingobium sp. EP60837]
MTLPSFGLEGKTALVTGASSGLGEHFARTLAAQGTRLILTARRTDLLQSLAASLPDARAMALDVQDASSIDRLWQQVGAVDILVNNAGVAGGGPLLDQDEAEWDRIMDTNARGTYLVARGAAQAIVAAGRQGSIINVASILGLRQAAQVGSYAISKAAVVQMSKVMALEWARHGIRVNALCPGYISTPLNAAFWEMDAGRALIGRIPQRRLGQPEDLDGALLLLASDLGAYITGAELVVDGGHMVNTL